MTKNEYEWRIVGAKVSTKEEATELSSIAKVAIVGHRIQEVSKQFQLKQLAKEVIEEVKEDEKKKGA